jgi:hypothetical protein
MTLDEQVLEEARQARQRLVDLESQTAHARVDYHHAIKRLHAAGGSLREIAEVLDLSHQRVHQIVEGPADPASSRVEMWGRPRLRRRRHGRRGAFFVRFDAAAREAMVQAQKEADSLRHGYVGTEHVLLALLRRGLGERTGLSVDVVRDEIVSRVGEGEEPVPPGMPRPFTPRAKRAMERALVESQAAKEERITPEHLLLALAEDEKATAGEILHALGLTPEQLRERLAG